MARRSLLALSLLIGLGSAACSDDSGPGPTADVVKPADTLRPGEAACAEGTKKCATLNLVQVCQGGRWVDQTDCSLKKDPTGVHPCTCSPTLMNVCQYGGKVCP